MGIFNTRKKDLEKGALERPFCSAVVPAAGNAVRMEGVDKLFLEIGGREVISYTLCALDECPDVDEIIISARRDDFSRLYGLIKDEEIEKPVKITAGGETRTESVYKAICECSEKAKLIAVHDAARPAATPELISRVIKKAAVCGAAVAAVPVKDTIKKVADGRIVETPPREFLYAAQTPQVFDAAVIRAAYNAAASGETEYTDDCAVAEAFGKKVYIAEGDYRNIKLTTPDDIYAIAAVLASM